MFTPRALAEIVAVIAIISSTFNLQLVSAVSENKNIPNEYFFDTSDVEMVPTSNNFDAPISNVSIDNRSGKYGYDDYLGALDSGYGSDTNEYGNYDYGEYKGLYL